MTPTEYSDFVLAEHHRMPVCRRAGETSSVVNVERNQHRVGSPRPARYNTRRSFLANHEDLLTHNSRRVSATWWRSVLVHLWIRPPHRLYGENDTSHQFGYQREGGRSHAHAPI
jgi:hypothetical protein